MFRRRLNEEAGYSLVEVMVSIIILAIAILPMVGMFDMGLQSATRGSNYDKSRALANLKLEEAKSLPFPSLQNNFPVAGSTPNLASGYYDSGFIPAGADFTNFQYRVRKQYVPRFELCSLDPDKVQSSPGACSGDLGEPAVVLDAAYPRMVSGRSVEGVARPDLA